MRRLRRWTFAEVAVRRAQELRDRLGPVAARGPQPEPETMAEEPRCKRRKQANPRRKNGNHTRPPARSRAHTHTHLHTHTRASMHTSTSRTGGTSRPGAAGDGAEQPGPLPGLARGPVAAPRAASVLTRSHASTTIRQDESARPFRGCSYTFRGPEAPKHPQSNVLSGPLLAQGRVWRGAAVGGLQTQTCSSGGPLTQRSHTLGTL